MLHLPPRTARLSLGPPYDPYGDGYIHRFDVELTDDGLTATTTATIDAVDRVRLDDFLYGLVDDWRGWDGVRCWHSLRRELVVDATHDRVRRVVLDITVQPGSVDPSWSARCRFEVEPGAQLAAIADEVATWLGPRPPGR